MWKPNTSNLAMMRSCGIQSKALDRSVNSAPKTGCYLIVQAPFINLRNIWEDTDRSIIFLRKLWLFLCAGTMSACFSSLGNFEERIESLMSSHVYFAKKSTFFFSRLVLISSFCAAFFGSRLWKYFCQFDVNLTEL